MSVAPAQETRQRHRFTYVEASPTPAPRRPWRMIALTGALLIAATLWDSAHRVGLGPTGGTNWSGYADLTREVPSRIRLGTFNIHGGKGMDNQRDLVRIAGEIRALDFVGLNEVEGPFLFETRNQAEELAALLRTNWLFAPGERRWRHYDFGNGGLARLPVEAWQQVPLPRQYGKGFRNLVLVRSRIGTTPLNIVVTHIDRSDDRERSAQLRFVADYFLALAEPAVLMGDMNSDANDPELRRLLDTPGVTDPLVAVHGEDVSRHIDWIFLRGLKVHDAGINKAGASDHPAVWAEVEYLPAGE